MNLKKYLFLPAVAIVLASCSSSNIQVSKEEFKTAIAMSDVTNVTMKGETRAFDVESNLQVKSTSLLKVDNTSLYQLMTVEVGGTKESIEMYGNLRNENNIYYLDTIAETDNGWKVTHTEELTNYTNIMQEVGIDKEMTEVLVFDMLAWNSNQSRYEITATVGTVSSYIYVAINSDKKLSYIETKMVENNKEVVYSKISCSDYGKTKVTLPTIQS